MQAFPLIIGHRGVPSLAPENTLASFQKAIEVGCDYIEIDVHLSKDKAPVIIHDYSLIRTSKRLFPFWVSQHKLESLKQIDVGSHFHPSFKKERIPTLSEVLTLCEGKIGLMLEIKRKKAPLETLKIIAPYLKNFSSPLILGSQEPAVLKAISQVCPEIPCIHIAEKPLRTPFLALHIRSLSSPSFSLPIKREKCWVWTVNKEQELNTCLKHKVGGIISDYPQWLIQKKVSFLNKP